MYVWQTLLVDVKIICGNWVILYEGKISRKFIDKIDQVTKNKHSVTAASIWSKHCCNTRSFGADNFSSLLSITLNLVILERKYI